MTQKAEMKRTSLVGSQNKMPITFRCWITEIAKKGKILSKSEKSIRQAFWALLLGISILAGLWSFGAVPVKAAGFTDIKGSEWYAADVTALAASSNEIIKGYPDGSFRADVKLTADQFITMLVRAGGQTAANNSEYWAIPYLNKAKEMGILQDGDFSDFRAEISREEMALLMMRFLAGCEDLSKLESGQAEEAILDFVLVGAYQKTTAGKEAYQKVVKEAYALGLLTGYEDTSFKPQGILTRAEAATVIMRLLTPSRRPAFQPE